MDVEILNPLFLSKISDWLILNRDMLKQQKIPVGNIDIIANAIDKQKVRKIEWKKIMLELNYKLQIG